MRLINADDLIKAFEALALMSGEYQESFTNVDGNRSMEIACAEDIINKAKTIDAEPVKHARWIPYESETGEGSNTYKCSSCGEIQMLIEGTPKENGWKYCPHCGAMMLRGEQDG